MRSRRAVEYRRYLAKKGVDPNAPRKPKAPPKRPLPPISKAWPGVTILAIDPAAVSGAAIHVYGPDSLPVGRRPELYTVRDAAKRADVVEIAKGLDRESELVVVMESWSDRGAFGDATTQRGLGAAAGRWLEALEAAGVPKSRVVRVEPARWYRAVIGGAKRRDDKTTVIEAMRLRWPGLHPEQLTPDAAEAAAIGLWASQAGELGLVLPIRLVRAHLAAIGDPGLLAEIERRRGVKPTA